MAASGVIILWYGTIKAGFVCGSVAMASLLFFTLITPLWMVTAGTLLPYAALVLLLCVNFSKIVYALPLRVSWAVVNVVNLALSAFIVADCQPVKEFLRANYSAFYDTLVPDMLGAGKPVLMFGSHSIAAFFFFVCFYLHLKSYTAKRSNWCFLAALAYLGLLLLLKSVSAYFLFPAGFALLIYYSWGRRAMLLIGGVAIAATLGAILVSGTAWNEMAANFEKVWTAPENGFQGRYFGSGVLAQDLQYILTHPLRGTGIGFSESLWYGDSGPVELLLRGSIPLVLAIYGGLWFFLTRSLLSRSTAITVFLIYFAFEIAYSNLLYLRTLCVLPFVIAHLNGLARGRATEALRRIEALGGPVLAKSGLTSCSK